MKNKLLILIAFLSIGFVSCDLGDDPDIGGTATQALAGEYFVQLFSEPGGDLYVDYTLVTISNTAANTADKIRLKDDEHIWGFNSEFNADVNNRTFSGDVAPNALYSISEPAASPFQPIGTIDTAGTDFPKFMTITGGGVFLGEADVPSGTTADSVAFSATAIYYANIFRVIAHEYDTVSTNPLTIDTLSVFEFVSEYEDFQDGPYFLSGYRRTGFLEDEH